MTSDRAGLCATGPGEPSGGGAVEDRHVSHDARRECATHDRVRKDVGSQEGGKRGASPTTGRQCFAQWGQEMGARAMPPGEQGGARRREGVEKARMKAPKVGSRAKQSEITTGIREFKRHPAHARDWERRERRFMGRGGVGEGDDGEAMGTQGRQWTDSGKETKTTVSFKHGGGESMVEVKSIGRADGAKAGRDCDDYVPSTRRRGGGRRGRRGCGEETRSGRGIGEEARVRASRRWSWAKQAGSGGGGNADE
ncbi:hypothetical protein EDB89DRAFT_1902344 [Lactarius sanguifluus]|nr:hypothetical protein EDB89DRAFT_1902344 [Lactarius sanguifluus]